MNQKKSGNRRNFIKKGLAGAAGLSVLPSLKALSASGSSDCHLTDSENKIIFRTLGRTGYKVPIISMGTSTNEYLIKAALKAGIVHFDTANGYGKGLDENIFGRALRGVPRDSYVIATKVYGIRDDATNLLPENISPEEYKSDFRQRMEESLRRLHLDYVDILYLHAVDNPDLLKMDVIREIMLEMKEQGKTKFLGISTHNPEVIYTIVEEEIYDVILISHNFREENPEVTKKAIQHAVDAGCGIVGMKSRAGMYWDEERKQLINAQAALKWLINDENIHTTIISMNTFQQLHEYMAIMNDITLTPDEIKDLRLGEKDETIGMFCNQCEVCLPQCPHHINIPRLMRSYMYAFGYHKPAKAKETLEMVDTRRINCTQCPVCLVTCPSGFDVKSKITNISRLLNVPDEFLV